MNVTDEQKQRMAANLDRSFELLKTTMELKLAYFKKLYPRQTEDELNQKIHLDIIEAKERQWRLQTI